MSPKDLLIASVVIVAWGVNFVVIKLGLHGVPPMLLGALRFALAAVPVVFVKRPQIPLRWLFAYSLTISLGQFALLFYGMYVGMPAGLASLVLQAQAFFTLIFASMFLGERIRAANVAGLVIAAAGLALIGMRGGQAMTLAGFLFTLAASAMWALGNVATKRMGKVDLLSLVVWGSLIPPLPFLALSLIFEGPRASRRVSRPSRSFPCSRFSTSRSSRRSSVTACGGSCSRATRREALRRFRCSFR